MLRNYTSLSIFDRHKQSNIIKLYCVACAIGILFSCRVPRSTVIHYYYFVKQTKELLLLQPSTNSFFYTVSSTFTFPKTSDVSFQNLYLKNKISEKIIVGRVLTFILVRWLSKHFSARLSFGLMIS